VTRRRNNGKIISVGFNLPSLVYGGERREIARREGHEEKKRRKKRKIKSIIFLFLITNLN
jgi:hypothetical protein